MNRVLVTGGAGYIGSILTRLLLAAGHQVMVLDNLLFGGESIADLLNDPNFKFVKGDIRCQTTLQFVLDFCPDAIVHLAAIVGDPACAMEPKLARETNLEASKQLFDLAERQGVKRFIFASTCSNYGDMQDPGVYLTEISPLAPVSLYAKTKVAVEEYLFSKGKNIKCKPVALRFSTAYGLSPRPRFDLVVNEFTRDLLLGRELIIYGENFWRPYCHVEDIARAVLTVVQAKESKVSFEVFNVGDTTENYQKQMILDEIEKQVHPVKICYVQNHEKPRNYRVSFEKISTVLGFKITKTVPEGIAQIKQVLESGLISNPDNPRYRNLTATHRRPSIPTYGEQ